MKPLRFWTTKPHNIGKYPNNWVLFLVNPADFSVKRRRFLLSFSLLVTWTETSQCQIVNEHQYLLVFFKLDTSHINVSFHLFSHFLPPESFSRKPWIRKFIHFPLFHLFLLKTTALMWIAWSLPPYLSISLFFLSSSMSLFYFTFSSNSYSDPKPDLTTPMKVTHFLFFFSFFLIPSLFYWYLNLR